MISNEKVILGSTMFLAGFISVAILLAGSMLQDWTVDGRFSAFWNIFRFGLIPVLYVFAVIAIIGMILQCGEHLKRKTNSQLMVYKPRLLWLFLDKPLEAGKLNKPEDSIYALPALPAGRIIY